MLRAPVASPPDCTKEKRWSAVNCRDAFRAKKIVAPRYGFEPRFTALVFTIATGVVWSLPAGRSRFALRGIHWTEAGSRPSASPSVVPYSWLCPAECGLSPLSSVACAASSESVSPRGIVSFTLRRAVRHGAGGSVRTLAALPRNAPHRPARGTRHRYAGWPRQRFPCAAG